MKKCNLFFVLIFIFQCTISLQAQTDSAHLAKLYIASISGACPPTQSKIVNTLVSIRPENKNLVHKTIEGEDYILALSLKNDTTYYQNNKSTGKYNTGNYRLWVTAAPELKKKFSMMGVKDTSLRLKQLLGLPPTSTYRYFIEFWVRPQDLFRPCPDKEISDGSCDLCFPEKTDSTYINWINESRINRYYNCKPYDNYPWTQLGYTYDWNPQNKSHIGLSEFVVDVNKYIIVNRIYTVQEYLRKPKK